MARWHAAKSVLLTSDKPDPTVGEIGRQHTDRQRQIFQQTAGSGTVRSGNSGVRSPSPPHPANKAAAPPIHHRRGIVKSLKQNRVSEKESFVFVIRSSSH
jgi:hypothetical protein